MTAITQELEVLKVSKETKLTLKNEFLPFFEQAEEWKNKAENLVVTDISQKEEMAQAREARLALKKIRTETENKRKELKEESLRKGKAIDGMANVIKYLITPIEEHLKKQEDFEKIETARIKAELSEKREKQLSKYEVETSFYNLGEMPEESFQQLLDNSKMAFEAKKEAARKAEEERIAKEKAEQEERERIRKENEKLRAEAEKRAKEEAVRKKAEEAERKAREEKERKERAEHEAKLRKEREAREKIEAELRAKKEAEEKAKKEAEAKAKAEEAARKKREKEERLAPDKIKLQNLAKSIVEIQLPEVKSDEAKEVLRQVQTLLNKTSNYIKEKTIEL